MTTTSAGAQTLNTLVSNYGAMHDALTRGAAFDIGALSTPPMDLELDEAAAYELQSQVNSEIVRTLGWSAAGYKISMTAPEDRTPVRADGPSSGVLFSHQFIGSGKELRLDQTNSALLEPELVFRATEEIRAGSELDELASALEVTGGIEIPMSRVPDWFPPGDPPIVDLATFIADNSAAGFVVLAEGWTPADSLDTAQTTVQFTEPDGTVLEGAGSRVMDGPLTSMRWLFERLLAEGGSIPAGTLVSSGTFMPPRRAAHGSFEAAFSHGLGTPTVTFR